MTEQKKWQFLDGEPELIRAIAMLKEEIAAGKTEHQGNLTYLEQLLAEDINLRIRIQAAKESAQVLNPVLDHLGHPLEVPHRDKPNETVLTQVPFGLTDPPAKIIDQVRARIRDTLRETEASDAIADLVIELIAPIEHRLHLADAVLLDLRKFSPLEVNNMHPRTAGRLSDIVALAEIVTGGAFPEPYAKMQGYVEGDWIFDPIPTTEDPKDVGARKLVVYAGGAETFALAMNYIEIQQQPQPGGQMGVIAYVDNGYIQLIAPNGQLIPVNNVACWRLATKEEEADPRWEQPAGYHKAISEQYLAIQKHLGEPVKPDNSKGPKLLMPDGVSQESSGLILPPGVTR